MKVFLVGASGFVGESILSMLLQERHEVTGCVRNPQAWMARYPDVRWVQGDYTRDHDPSAWAGRIGGSEVIINAVGIIRETPSQSFADLHQRGPVALFDAAAACGIRMVLQISALGADEQSRSAYHLSKRAADRHLASLGLDHVILQPSLVMGRRAESTRLFSALSLLPVLGLPGGGSQMLQPVSIEDLVAGIRSLLHHWPAGGRCFAVAGARAFSLAQIIERMRPLRWRAMSFPVPMRLVHAVARLHLGLLDPEAIDMLERGNCGDALPFEEATGIRMRSLEEFWAPGAGRPEGTVLLLSALLPILRVSVAILWIWTGIVSSLLYPVEQSFRWLFAAGIPEKMLGVALYGASALDVMLGLALLSLLRRPVYLLQLLLVLFYTVMISVALPDLWLHPFGPVSKNLPLLAATLVGFLLDGPKVRQREGTR